MNISMVIIGLVIVLVGGYLFYAARKIRKMPLGEESKNIKHFTDNNFT